MPNKGFSYDYDATHEIQTILEAVENELKNKNIQSRDLVIMGHSFGGSVGQKFVNKWQEIGYKQWKIVGQVLMGSAIDRTYVSIEKDGTSKIDFLNPVFTITGELDGLMRMSRVAE